MQSQLSHGYAVLKVNNYGKSIHGVNFCVYFLEWLELMSANKFLLQWSTSLLTWLLYAAC